MSDRITAVDVEMQLDRLKSSARAVLSPEWGQRIDRWHVQSGSPSNGIAWRLYQLGSDLLDTAEWRTPELIERYPYGTGHSSCAGLPDYLGMTASDAYRSLQLLARAFETITYTRQLDAERNKR